MRAHISTFRKILGQISVSKISLIKKILPVIFNFEVVSINFCILSLHLLMFNFHLSKYEAIFHLSEIISEVTYEISVITYPSFQTGQVKFSHDPLTNGYSLGAPLGFHRLHRNAYLIVGEI